jgi:hypothetical protein
MEACPAISNPLWEMVFPLFRRDEIYHGTEYRSRKEAFQRIYNENRWQSPESRSGHGSVVSYTKRLIPRLEKLLLDLEVKTFLDAPCGDFNWIRHMRLPEGARYLGGDIVPELIKELQAKHGGPKYEFSVMDIVEGPLPAADFWLCRAALFHLPNRDILTTLELFAASQIRYLLTTTSNFPRENRDIEPGGFRFLNLRRPPFNLPRPLRSVTDFVAPEAPSYLDLWSREQVQQALRQRSSGAA